MTVGVLPSFSYTTQTEQPLQKQTTSIPPLPTLSALQVTQHAYKGRCYTAQTHIKAGDIILQENPYAVIVDSESWTKICSNCMKEPVAGQPQNSIICECQFVTYCSETCQQKDSLHQLECKFWTDMKILMQKSDSTISSWDGYTFDFTRLLTRVLCQYIFEQKEQERNHNNNHNNNNFKSSNFHHVWSMVSNQDSFSQNQKDLFLSISSCLSVFLVSYALPAQQMSSQFSWPNESQNRSEYPLFPLSQTNTTSTVIKPTTTTPPPPPPPLPPTTQSTFPLDQYEAHIPYLLELIMKEECNSFGLYTFEYTGSKTHRQPFGLALHPQAIFFNHSCSPNAGYVSRHGQLIFYALQDLNPNDEICISYLPLEKDNNASSIQRKEYLKKTFFFDCDCERCNNPHFDDTKLSNNLCFVKDCKGWFVPKSISTVNPSCTSFKDESKRWYCEGCGFERI